ncbi:MAG TPA: hypothetical protein ENN60_01995 [archaeon]|nr:hypothetical protein [archaeon]
MTSKRPKRVPENQGPGCHDSEKSKPAQRCAQGHNLTPYLCWHGLAQQNQQHPRQHYGHGSQKGLKQA